LLSHQLSRLRNEKQNKKEKNKIRKIFMDYLTQMLKTHSAFH